MNLIEIIERRFSWKDIYCPIVSLFRPTIARGIRALCRETEKEENENEIIVNMI